MHFLHAFSFDFKSRNYLECALLRCFHNPFVELSVRLNFFLQILNFASSAENLSKYFQMSDIIIYNSLKISNEQNY